MVKMTLTYRVKWAAEGHDSCAIELEHVETIPLAASPMFTRAFPRI